MRLGMNMLLWSTDVTGDDYAATFAMLKDAGFEGIARGPQPDQPRSRGSRARARGDEGRGSTRARRSARRSCAGRSRRRSASSAVRRRRPTSARGPSRTCAPPPSTPTRATCPLVEYLNRFEMYLVNSAADAASLVREVDHPRCRMMYDTFHAHTEEKDPRAALQECKDVLFHVHLSENDRSTPGAGQVDWDTTLDALREIGYDRWVVIEAFGDSLPELAGTPMIWRGMFESEEQRARDGAAFVRGKLDAA